MLVSAAALPVSHADLLHRYSFSEPSGAVASDSVGGAHGTIKGTGASWGGGTLHLPGGSSASAAYVDLPNGIISGLTDLTVEVWATQAGTGAWARIFDFGSTTAGELTGPGGNGSGLDYLFLSAARGDDEDLQRTEIRDEDPPGGGTFTIDTSLNSVNGTRYHHSVVFDADGAGGLAELRYYRDGTLAGQATTTVQLADLNDVNNWLGRSNWTGDQNFQGSYDEFRIYDTALTEAEIDASRAAGPDTVPGADPPAITRFAAAPTTIFSGQSATLSWTIDNPGGALAVTVEPGPGAIPGDPASGSVAVSPAATTTYTLTATNPDGSDSAQVTVAVDPGVPVAAAQSVSTFVAEPVAITLGADDPDGGDLTFEVVAPPAHGTLDGVAPDLLYTPAAGFAGTDTFTFAASDGAHTSAPAVVSITVLERPAPPDDIQLAPAAVPASTGAGDFIAEIDADDPNPGDTHAFALVPGAGDTHNALFAVSADLLLAAADFSAFAGQTLSLRLRATGPDGLSFEKALTLSVSAGGARAVINEIHYDPPDGSLPGEFIELHNPGDTPFDLTGWSLSGGADFAFPDGSSIPAGGYLVVAQDPATAAALYGVTALGPWDGRLSSGGERVRLRDPAGGIYDQVEYGAGFPWPVAPGGGGGSMELLDPGLDNDLGSSWRVSLPTEVLGEATLLPLGAGGWSWRPGDTEASAPTDAWRAVDFAEDGSWTAGASTPIGYGTVNGVPIATEIAGMRNNYRCLFLRRSFEVEPGEIPTALQVSTTSDDGIIVWINGVEVARHRVTGEPTIATSAQTQGDEGSYETVAVANAAGFVVEGTNTIAVQLFNATIGSSDLGFDLELLRPAEDPTAAAPTPGAPNASATASAPPNIRQVRHAPERPGSGQSVTVTAKVTDPDGVARVDLLYQSVAPGAFIPSRTPRTVPQIMADPEGEPPLNPAFEDPANWVRLTMRDDGAGGDALAGDGTYTAGLPARPHRTLMRYRIEVEDAAGNAARVPYPDDASLNFAYFVYDGVPDYVASTRSVHPDGAGRVWPSEMLEDLPVYHWLIRAEDMATLQAYNAADQFTNNGSDAELSARRAWDWEGALVYDGVVYDHIRARLRGGNSRYGDFDNRFPRGKRHYKFRFNRGYYFAAKDEQGRPYEEKWRIFNVSRMFGTKGGNSWGLPEEIGDYLYHTMGVPTQRAHWFHFRVVDDAEEAPDQYRGDFWGLMQAQERYDVRFLESRGLQKGNLYKLSDFYFDAGRQRRHQALGMVSDGSEFDNIRFNLHGGQTAAWLNQYVNYEKWYGYSAVGEAIRHYDIFPEPSGRHRLKNLVWYFEPTGADPARGVCWQMPYDYDASWGPNFNNGWDHANNGLYGHVIVDGRPYIDKPEMKVAHRNVLRSFRDLVWQRDQIEGLIDDRAALIADFSLADQDRWRGAPADAGSAVDDPLTFKVGDMKDFAFNGWSANSGPAVPAGGRALFLDAIADGPDAGLLPARPTLAYTGAAGFPTDALSFTSGAFSDPQGAGSFAAMEWRAGEIEDPSAPAHDPADDFKLENDLIWGSGELAAFSPVLHFPGGALRVGRTYRVRVRHRDDTGRWSHWSQPVEFTTSEPLALSQLQQNLVVSEIMYHPAPPTGPEAAAGFVESDFEFLELHNISAGLTLDLTDVRLTKGADFDFASGAVTALPPGGYVLVVNNLAAFTMRYGPGLPVAGEWDPSQNLSNGGEPLKVSHGAGTAVRDFDYDDRSPWPEAPDGDGPSLVLDDPASNPDHALAGSWRASHAPFGSPGAADIASPFLAWMAAMGFADPLADPTGSGVSNLAAYALGADLLPARAQGTPTASVVTVGGTEFPAITYRVRSGATDIDSIVETSTDLATWQTGTTVPFATVDNGDGTQSVTVRATSPLTGERRLYLRLRLELQ